MNKIDYKNLSYDQLLSFEKKAPALINSFHKKINDKDSKIKKLENNLSDIDQKIAKLAEQRIGVKPGGTFNKYIENLTNKYFSYFVITCFSIGFYHLAINVNMPIVLAIMGAFIFIGPLIMIGVLLSLTILETVVKFLIGGDAQSKYDKKFASLCLSIKKGKYQKLIKTSQTQIDNFKEENFKLESESRIIQDALYEIDNLKRKAKKKEDRAKIAAFNNKARSAAGFIRLNLIKEIKNKRNWKCPYCFLHYDISDGKHSKLTDADHIHPIHKGGLSTKQNMVLVCKKCNSKKKTSTLRQFCKLQRLNYDKTCSMLEKMGKDV